jgi:putative hydrolase of the HAD superfamily
MSEQINPDSIKVFLFDAAGVLFEKNLAVGEALENELGLSKEAQLPIWNELHRKLSSGKLSVKDFFNKLSELFDIEPENIRDVFVQSFEDSFKPMPGMEELLAKLKSKGNKLAVLSDTTPLFNESRKKFDIYKYFDKVFLSYEIGALKPDSKMYETVIKDYKLEPSDFLFIDDQEKNVLAARQLGMQAVVFENTNQLEKLIY